MIELATGSVFGGRYQVTKSIGSGGMGAVYLATDPRYRDFKVALKVLYPGIIKTPEARERFQTEIIASYKIPHRNIVRAYEYFDEENVQAYAMEFVDGGDLQMLMKDGGITLEETLSILRQSAAGLHAIHSQDIMHRDLKPENILLTRHGIVKIGDFGVARLRESNTSVTQIGAMVGTPKYFSPEYIETGETDHRGDIYALGVIGYELVSGVSPFRSDSRIGMMVERIKRPQEPLHSIAPHCPKDLARVIEKAMAVSVMERYQSAEEMREDLMLIQESKPPKYARDFIESEVIDRPEQTVKSNVSMSKISDRSKSGASFGSAGFSPAVEVARIKKKTLAIISFFAMLFIASAVLIYFANEPDGSLLTLQPGVYEGPVHKIDKSGKIYKMVVWKTVTGRVAVQLSKGNCSAASLDPDSRFTCQGVVYQVRVDSSNEISALGRIKEAGSLSWGSWSVSHSLQANSKPLDQ